MEIRGFGADLTSWEARCNVAGWTRRDVTGALPIHVSVELAGGGNVSGTAYVDRAFHMFRDTSDLKLHGTELGLKVRNLGRADSPPTPMHAVGEALRVPVRVGVFLLVAVATILLFIFVLLVVFAPEVLFHDRPAF